MNGLLLKDWISLRTSIVLVAIVFVFCTALFVPWGVSSVAFLIGIAMALLLPVNAMTLDTASRWERYVLALPLSRREILAARYQFAYLCLGAVALICGIAAVASVLFLDGYDLLGVSPMIWWAGCVGIALLILDLMLAVYADTGSDACGVFCVSYEHRNSAVRCCVFCSNPRGLCTGSDGPCSAFTLSAGTSPGWSPGIMDLMACCIAGV